MCLYPKLIRNRKYTETKKNGGKIPPVTDRRVLMIPVGCQQCIECRKQKARAWQVRLHEEIRRPAKREFVTLTFSNESYKELYKEINTEDITNPYEIDNEIATLAVRRFLERWRAKYKKSIRHWLITELGHNGTEHIHIHGLLETDKKEEISKIWGYGYTFCGDYVNERTINYVTKYVMKTDEKHPNYIPKMLVSKGIGAKYFERHDAQLNAYKEKKTKETYTTRQGIKINLPIYFRNKIYSDEEREKLWIERLDKQERWVLGTRIDVSKGDEKYYSALRYARTKNRMLGYGGHQEKWEVKEYEYQRRWLKQKERLGQDDDRSLPLRLGVGEGFKAKPIPIYAKLEEQEHENILLRKW